MTLPIDTTDTTWNTGDSWGAVNGPDQDAAYRAQQLSVTQGDVIETVSLRVTRGDQVQAGDNDDCYVVLVSSLEDFPSNPLATSSQVASETLEEMPAYGAGQTVTEAFVPFTFSSPYTAPSDTSVFAVLTRTQDLGGFVSKALGIRLMENVYAGGSSYQYDELTDFEWTEDQSVGTTYDWEMVVSGSEAPRVLYVANTGFRFPYQRWM